jgi:hypothetical protein
VGLLPEWAASGRDEPPTSNAIKNSNDKLMYEFRATTESSAARHMVLLLGVYCLSRQLVGGTTPHWKCNQEQQQQADVRVPCNDGELGSQARNSHISLLLLFLIAFPVGGNNYKS